MRIVNSEVEKIAYLDGLRGVAAVMVFLDHLMISLLPATVTFLPPEAHSGWDIRLGQSPLAFLWCGNFAVCIFFVLSGFVLSDFCGHSRISFAAKVVRRYFRLALPMLITSAFAWLLLKLGLYKNLDASEVTRSGWLSMWYRFEPDFFFMVKEALYGAFVNGRADYNSNLWTMKLELIGSVYVFLCFALFGSRNLRLLAILAFIWFNRNYYALFACGVLLYDWRGAIATYVKGALKSSGAREATITGAFLAGLYLGAYPELQPNTASPWHSWLPFSRTAVLWHMLGAVLVVSALLQSKSMQQILSGRVAKFFGKISFVLYLVHIPVICSLTAAVAYLLRDSPYLVVMMVAGSVTVVAVVACSALIYKYADLYTTSFSRRAGQVFDAWFTSNTDGIRISKS